MHQIFVVSSTAQPSTAQHSTLNENSPDSYSHPQHSPIRNSVNQQTELEIPLNHRRPQLHHQRLHSSYPVQRPDTNILPPTTAEHNEGRYEIISEVDGQHPNRYHVQR